jgi:tetratricopeptide (TPR) repeat protein
MPTGRDRIRAVHHLAGGSHRVYVIFSEFLTRESLDELVEAFMQTLDDLTPYYQARMTYLSPQQRKIIEFLCDRRYAVPVKEIAQRCFMTHQTASGQLKDLREKGYVTSEAIGRESYYEVREPLMRFCLEVKKQRGEPIRLFVDFLRLWYTPTELQQRLKLLPPHAALEREYVLRALQETVEEAEEYIETCLEDYYAYVEEENFAQALRVAEELVGIRGYVEDWLDQGFCLGILERYDEALVTFNKVIELEPNEVIAWFNQGVTLRHLERYDEALASFNKAIELEPNEAIAWFNRGVTLRHLERYDEALASFNKAIELDPNYLQAWVNRGAALGNLGRYDEALASCDKAIELDPNYLQAWVNGGVVLGNLGRYDEALVSFNKAIELDPNYLQAWTNRGWLLGKLGRYEEVLASYDKAIELDPTDADALLNRGWVLGELGRYEEALTSSEEAIALGEQCSYVFFNRAEYLLVLNRWDEGSAVLNDALNRFAHVDEPDIGDTAAIIRNLFNSTYDGAIWRSRITTLIALYDKHQVISGLGQGLVRSIPALMSEMVSDKAAQTWLEVWRELVGDRPEFQIPLRLLNTAVHYREKKGDKRVLLELPIEERELLKPLLESEKP